MKRLGHRRSSGWKEAQLTNLILFGPTGNSPDASGFYPGENRYKDPIRPDVDFASMMAERAEAEERAANPKPGDTPGCPGCRN